MKKLTCILLVMAVLVGNTLLVEPPAYAESVNTVSYSNISGNEWMKYIDGDKTLAQFNIPGSHDAASKECGSGMNTQGETVETQIYHGVRFLDLRLKIKGDDFGLYHSSAYGNITFAEIMQQTKTFLEQNPSECIIMSIKNEKEADGDEFSQVFERKYLNNSTWKNLFYVTEAIPKLDEVRGKIVIFRRYSGSNLGINAMDGWPDNSLSFTMKRNGYEINVQDRYKSTSNSSLADLWKAFVDQDNKLATTDTNNDPNNLWVNFSSGNVSGMGHEDTANAINGYLIERFNLDAGTGKLHGIIVMDWVRAQVIDSVYMSNAFENIVTMDININGGALKSLDGYHDVKLASRTTGKTYTMTESKKSPGTYEANVDGREEVVDLIIDGNSYGNVKSLVIDRSSGTVESPKVYQIRYETGEDIETAPLDFKVYFPGDEVKVNTRSFTSEGKTFQGWSLDGIHTIDSFMIQDDEDEYILRDLWTPNKYQITFDPNDGLGEQFYGLWTYTQKVASLDPSKFPSRIGYTFDGYYDQKTAGTKIVDATGKMITNEGKSPYKSDETLYAGWNPIEFYIDFCDDEENVIGSLSAKYNDVRLPGADGKIENSDEPVLNQLMTKDGYIFAGWSTALGQSTVMYEANRKYSTGIDSVEAEGDTVKLYPVWVENTGDITYAITYNLNGGDFNGDTVSEYTYAVGAELPTEDNISKKGHKFGGWYDNDDFTGNPVTSISPVSAGDKVFYAKWVPQTYEVTLNMNGGSIENGDVREYTYNTGAILPVKGNIKKVGYSFDGWYVDSTFTGAPVTSISPEETGDKIFYAKWKPIIYRIELYTKGGHFESEDDNITEYAYESELALPTAEQISKEGYKFGGWYDNSAYSGNPVISIPKTAIGSQSYFAKWIAETGSTSEYSISLSQSERLIFTAATVGYGARSAKEITVTNTGTEATGALTAALSGANASCFTLNKTSINSIAEGGTDTFTVKPNTGLAAMTYTATVTVSGENGITAQSFDVSFRVNQSTAGGGGGGGGGGAAPAVQKPTIETGEGVKVALSADGTTAIITAEEGYEITDVTLNGLSKEIVTTVSGLKTGDKLSVTARKKAEQPSDSERIASLKEYKLSASSSYTKSPKGKKAILIKWKDKNGKELKFDGVEIWRSTKRNSGYGKKPIADNSSEKYYNTRVKSGVKYYYKVRGYIKIDGKKYYTGWSTKTVRTAKKTNA